MRERPCQNKTMSETKKMPQCQFAQDSQIHKQCTAKSTTKQGDYWFCKKHGDRTRQKSRTTDLDKTMSDTPSTTEKLPDFPPNRLIYQTTFFPHRLCDFCGSSMRRKWFKITGCIQPECKNYYETNTTHHNTKNHQTQ